MAIYRLQSGVPPIGIQRSVIKPHRWLCGITQLTVLVVLGVVVANSTATGMHLLVIAIIWLLTLFTWLRLPWEGMWGFKVSARHRGLAKATVYAFVSLYELFLFGWIIPLGIGIYRLRLR